MATAVELARAYDAYVSALWRGDADVASFSTWLAALWCADPVPLLAAPPAAISPCGGGGRGIQWHDTPTGVLGCVPGIEGCYAVPPNAVPPSLRSPSIDVLISDRHQAVTGAVAAGYSPPRDMNEAVVTARPVRETTTTEPVQ